MNKFKGYLVCNNGVLVSSIIEAAFYNQLLVNENKVSDDFINFAKVLINKSRHEEVKLLSEFQSSPFVDNNDFYGSWDEFIINLKNALAHFSDDNGLVKKINELTGFDGSSNLDERLLFVSSIYSCFNDMSNARNLNLRSVMFVNNHDLVNDYDEGFSFWFNSCDSLISISTYYFNIKGSNSLLFNESLSYEIVSYFKDFNLSSGEVNVSNDLINEFVNKQLNKEFKCNDLINFEIVMEFNCRDLMLESVNNFYNFNSDEVNLLSDLALSVNSAQEQLFNNNLRSLLSLIYLKRGGEDLILVQRTNDSVISCAVYKLSSGNKTFREFLSYNIDRLGSSVG